jgi:phage baseplate assembly protein W
MATYIGFSTIDVNQPRNLIRSGVFGGTGTTSKSIRTVRKFRLTDEQLVIRDLLNSFSIKQGDIVGNPGYGSTLWNYIFEPNTADVRGQIETELRRLINNDPRINLNTLQLYYESNGILIELEIAINPFTDAIQLSFFLNRFDGSIQQLAR